MRLIFLLTLTACGLTGQMLQGISNAVVAAGGGAVPTLLTHTSMQNTVTSGNTATMSTSAIDTTGAAGAGGLLVYVVTTYNGAGLAVRSSFVDPQGNTWLGPLTQALTTSMSSTQTSVFICFNPTSTSASHIMNFTRTGDEARIFFAAFSGVTSSYQGLWVT